MDFQNKKESFSIESFFDSIYVRDERVPNQSGSAWNPRGAAIQGVSSVEVQIRLARPV